MLVSILIPCYNAQPWIGQSIQSALDQSWAEKEVIVVDDGSTDGSLDIIRSFGSAIRFETGPNQGGNVARNRLLDLARGEWLQYLDADDYLLPQKIARQFSEFDPAACDVSYSPVILLHCEGDQEPWEEFREIPEPRDLRIKLVRMELPQTAAPLWRKSALLDVGKWKADQPCCQELELYFRLLIGRKRFVYCPTAGVHYRQWSTQTVWRKNPMQTLGRWLAIIDAAELHLQQQGELSEARRDAIALARLRCARSIYQYEPSQARDVAKKAKRNHPRFSVLGSNDFPRSYRWAHHLVGFGLAERIAEITRPLKRQRGLQAMPAKLSVESSRRTTGDRASETAGVNG
jgi:glycosyltransferase involved in cell wall biosynthesis